MRFSSLPLSRTACRDGWVNGSRSDVLRRYEPSGLHDPKEATLQMPMPTLRGAHMLQVGVARQVSAKGADVPHSPHVPHTPHAHAAGTPHGKAHVGSSDHHAGDRMGERVGQLLPANSVASIASSKSFSLADILAEDTGL